MIVNISDLVVLEYKVLAGLVQVVGQRRSSRSRESQLLLVNIKRPTARLEPWSPEVLPVQVRHATTKLKGQVRKLSCFLLGS